MGTPLINQLWDEAVQRTGELTGRAQEAATETDEVLEHATALGTLAVAEGETLHHEITEVVEAVVQAQRLVVQATAEADTSLDALPARAEAAESVIRDLLAGVRQDVTHLGEVRARLMAAVETSMGQAEADFTELERRVRDLQDKLEARLSQAETELLQLGEAVEQARTHLDAERDKLRQAMHDLGVKAGDTAGNLAGTAEIILVTLGKNTVELLNHAIEAHNATVVNARTEFTSESQTASPSETWLNPFFKPIEDAITEFGDMRGPAETALNAAAKMMLDKAGDALEALESIGTSLEQASSKLSS